MKLCWFMSLYCVVFICAYVYWAMSIVWLFAYHVRWFTILMHLLNPYFSGGLQCMSKNVNVTTLVNVLFSGLDGHAVLVVAERLLQHRPHVPRQWRQLEPQTRRPERVRRDVAHGVRQVTFFFAFKLFVVDWYNARCWLYML